MEILFEDNWLLAVNKPAGLSTESGLAQHPSMEKALRDFIAERTRKTAGINRLVHDPYLRAVHRLDRPASGILLFAKNKSTLSDLMRQFEEGTVEKTYLAQTVRAPLPASGTLQHFIRKDETGKKALVSQDPVENARPCSLEYETLGQFGTETRLQIQPQTGKFHQIRAQLAFIDCPIVGDVQYGAEGWQEFEIKLQACRLSFMHPKTQKNLNLHLPPPPNW